MAWRSRDRHVLERAQHRRGGDAQYSERPPFSDEYRTAHIGAGQRADDPVRHRVEPGRRSPRLGHRTAQGRGRSARAVRFQFRRPPAVRSAAWYSTPRNAGCRGHDLRWPTSATGFCPEQARPSRNPDRPRDVYRHDPNVCKQICRHRLAGYLPRARPVRCREDAWPVVQSSRVRSLRRVLHALHGWQDCRFSGGRQRERRASGAVGRIGRLSRLSWVGS